MDFELEQELEIQRDLVNGSAADEDVEKMPAPAEGHGDDAR